MNWKEKLQEARTEYEQSKQALQEARENSRRQVNEKYLPLSIARKSREKYYQLKEKLKEKKKQLKATKEEFDQTTLTLNITEKRAKESKEKFMTMTQTHSKNSTSSGLRTTLADSSE